MNKYLSGLQCRRAEGTGKVLSDTVTLRPKLSHGTNGEIKFYKNYCYSSPILEKKSSQNFNRNILRIFIRLFMKK